MTAIMLLFAYRLNHKPIGTRIAACFEARCFDLDAGAKLRPVVGHFVAGTRFQGKINVDSIPRSGYLNFYVAKNLPPDLGSLKCNCAYVGSDIIICDHAFLETFASSVNFTRDSIYGPGSDKLSYEVADLLGKVNQATSNVLRSWIIGHEIGHAVLHEPASTERRLVMTRDKESAADTFFLDKAATTTDQRTLQNVSWGLNQLISQTIVISYQAGKARIAPSSDGVHDPWILRAVALGQRLVERSSDPNNDFYKSLLQTISVEPGGTSIGSFCEFNNIREQAARIQQERLNSSR